jgi:hypothetical protein
MADQAYHEPGWAANVEDQMEGGVIPAYEVTATGGRVGAPVFTFTSMDLLFGTWRVNALQTAVTPNDAEETLVFMTGALDESKQLWAARRSLRAATYDDTITKIAAAKKQDDEELDAFFWTERKAGAKDLINQAITFGESWKVTTKDGTQASLRLGASYRVVRLFDQACGAMSKFGLVVADPDSQAELIVPYEALMGTDTEAEQEAQQRGTATRLRAEDIVGQLSKSSLKPWLTKLTLTDDHLHYVTANQMGMVFVLNRPPGSYDKPQGVRRIDPDRFDEGRGTPGVRIGDDIFVHTDHLGISTEHHETLHLASHPNFLADLGWHFNEGTTEYFTRIVTGEHNLVRSEEQYLSQCQAVQLLIERKVVSHEQLAEAYFRGRTGALLAAFDQRQTGLSLEAYARHVKPSHSSAARAVLMQALDRHGS